MQSFKNYVAKKITQIERKYDENPTGFVVASACIFLAISVVVVTASCAP